MSSDRSNSVDDSPVLIESNSAQFHALQGFVQKLLARNAFSDEDDSTLSEYITVMLCNRKTPSQITTELLDLIGQDFTHSVTQEIFNEAIRLTMPQSSSVTAPIQQQAAPPPPTQEHSDAPVSSRPKDHRVGASAKLVGDAISAATTTVSKSAHSAASAIQRDGGYKDRDPRDSNSNKKGFNQQNNSLLGRIGNRQNDSYNSNGNSNRGGRRNDNNNRFSKGEQNTRQNNYNNRPPVSKGPQYPYGIEDPLVASLFGFSLGVDPGLYDRYHKMSDMEQLALRKSLVMSNMAQAAGAMAIGHGISPGAPTSARGRGHKRPFGSTVENPHIPVAATPPEKPSAEDLDKEMDNWRNGDDPAEAAATEASPSSMPKSGHRPVHSQAYFNQGQAITSPYPITSANKKWVKPSGDTATPATTTTDGGNEATSVKSRKFASDSSAVDARVADIVSKKLDAPLTETFRHKSAVFNTKEISSGELKTPN